MLRTILSITGKPGLFKIVSQGNRMLIVEDLNSKKRTPVHTRDKVVSLGDIAMYTEGEDKPLGEILDLVYANMGGKKIDMATMKENDALRAKFGEILPDFDRDRVYPSDIRKLFTWYNLLVDAGFTEFAIEEKKDEDAGACAETESPAEAISEATDAIAEEKECAETESPAEAISEATDKLKK